MRNNIGDIVEIDGLLFKHRVLIITGFHRNMISVCDIIDSKFEANINSARITSNSGCLSEKFLQKLNKRIVAKLKVSGFDFNNKKKVLTSIELMRRAKSGDKEAKREFLIRYGKLIK